MRWRPHGQTKRSLRRGSQHRLLRPRHAGVRLKWSAMSMSMSIIQIQRPIFDHHQISPKLLGTTSCHLGFWVVVRRESFTSVIACPKTSRACPRLRGWIHLWSQLVHRRLEHFSRLRGYIISSSTTRLPHLTAQIKHKIPEIRQRFPAVLENSE